MREYSTEEKYQYLLSKLKAEYIDLYEQDALLEMPTGIYYQFSDEKQYDIDSAIQWAMNDEGI